MLNQQTEFFRAIKDYNNLDSYRSQLDTERTNTKLFDTIYNCEFLGFIDKNNEKVGCMLHPDITGRTDLRKHCFYGTKICSGHFCPAYSCLKTSEQTAVIKSVDDWYLYGLVITDIDFVKEFFKHIENKIGDSIKEENLSCAGINTVLKDFFILKESWKFKSGENRLGKYYFSNAEYNVARIEYKKKWGVSQSRFDRIFVSLESKFNTKDDLLEAEAVIEKKINMFIKAYNAGT